MRTRSIIRLFIKIHYPDVWVCWDYITDPLRTCGQLYGDQQACKTGNMIAIHFGRIFLQNQACIHCVPIREDVDQFEQSVDAFNKKWVYYATQHGCINPPILLTVRAGSLKLDENCNVVDKSNIKNIFDTRNSSNKIVISLVHNDQLYRLSKLLYNKNAMNQDMYPDRFRPYTTMWDESHITLYHKPTDLMLNDLNCPEDVQTWPVKISLYEAIETVMANSSQLIGVSATPAQNFFSSDYKVDFLIDCRAPDNYRNVLNVEYNIIDDLPPKVKVIDDDELLRFIGNLSMMPRLERSRYNLCQDHPVFGLIQVSRYHEQHEKIRDIILSNFGDKFTVIIHNCKGLEINFPDDLVSHIRVEQNNSPNLFVSLKETNGRREVCRISDSKRVNFRKVTALHSALQNISNWGDHIERVILISGDTVKQGRRINSTDFRIALTDLFIRDDSTMDNGQQKNRAVGIRPDARPIRLWCTKRYHHDIIHNYKSTIEIKDKMKIKLNTEVRSTSYDILHHLKFSVNKLCENKMCKAVIPMEIVEDNSDDFRNTVVDYECDVERSESTKSRRRRALNKRKKEEEKKSNAKTVTLVKDNLTSSQKKIYNRIIEYITSKHGTGKWVNRSVVVDNIARTVNDKNPLRGRMSEMVDNQPSNNRNKDANTQGVLFETKGRTIYIRVN
jgi:hypothetical protein